MFAVPSADEPFIGLRRTPPTVETPQSLLKDGRHLVLYRTSRKATLLSLLCDLVSEALRKKTRQELRQQEN